MKILPVKMIQPANYRPYTSEMIEKIVDDIKKLNHEVYYYCFTYGSYRFSVVYQPNFFGRHHIAFYAITKGLELLTSSGYRTEIFEQRDLITREEIESFYRETALRNGLDLIKLKPDLMISNIKPFSGEFTQLKLF